MKAKKKYGQNFLIDQTVLEKISNSVLACENDLIIEIGPGKGALTTKLATKLSNIVAYEIDRDLIPILNKLKLEKLNVKNIDFLKTDITNDIKNINYEKLFIVGNLPYYITTPILEHIIKSNIKHESVTIMVQLEVANRFLAEPKTKNYGYFTVYLQHFYKIKRLVNVKNTSFDPAPKVESAVIQLVPKENIKDLNEDYFNFIKECFKEKRKTLKNNLRNYNLEIINNILIKNNLNLQARAEECSEEIFIQIYENLKK